MFEKDSWRESKTETWFSWLAKEASLWRKAELQAHEDRVLPIECLMDIGCFAQDELTDILADQSPQGVNIDVAT